MKYKGNEHKMDGNRQNKPEAKKNKKKNQSLSNRQVTMKRFFQIQWQVIKELYGQNAPECTMVLLGAVLVPLQGFIELRLLEYATNSVTAYMGNTLGEGFSVIACNILLFLLSLILVQLLSAQYRKIFERYQSKMAAFVEKKIDWKISHISYEYFESAAFYEKINLARQASDCYPNALFGIKQFFEILLLLITYGVMLSRVSLWFVLIVFLSIGISSIMAASVTTKQLEFWRLHVSPESRRAAYFGGLTGNRIYHQNIQTARTIPFFSEKYRFYNMRERKNYLHLNLLSFSTDIATSLLFLITFLATSLRIVQEVVDGSLEIGYYSMVIALLINLFSTLKQFSYFMLNRSFHVNVLQAYYEVFMLEEHIGGDNVKSEDTFTSTVSTLEKVDSEFLKIRNLQYQYLQSPTKALKGIDLSVNPGEKIAIVGQNGSGKTTLISVILGLLKHYEGSYQHQNLHFSAVLQDFGQYQMSVRENIETGRGGRKLSDEKIWNILKQVELYEFFQGKPDGIDTRHGQLEAGEELSKGQWQRIAIARLLADEEANVWILDEPTAYLDPIAEIEMYRFIFRLAGNRTVFFISHRLGFARDADRIIVVEDGNIVEEGTHQALMRQSNSHYVRMYQAQKAWYL